MTASVIVPARQAVSIADELTQAGRNHAAIRKQMREQDRKRYEDPDAPPKDQRVWVVYARTLEGWTLVQFVRRSRITRRELRRIRRRLPERARDVTLAVVDLLTAQKNGGPNVTIAPDAATLVSRTDLALPRRRRRTTSSTEQTMSTTETETGATEAPATKKAAKKSSAKKSAAKKTSAKKTPAKKASAKKVSAESPARSMSRTVGNTLVPILEKAGAKRDLQSLAKKLANDEKLGKRQLTELRDGVNELASEARTNGKEGLASTLSGANRLVRRLARAQA